MKRFRLCIILLLITSFASAQNYQHAISKAQIALQNKHYSKVFSLLSPVLNQNIPDTAKAKIFELFSEAYQKQKNIQQAIYYATKEEVILRKYYQKSNDSTALKSLLKTYIRLALLFEAQTQVQGSINYFEKALLVAQKLQNFKAIANIYQFLGRDYHYIGQYFKAIKFYQQSNKIYLKYKLYDKYLNSLLLEGIAYERTGNIKQAVQLFFRCLQIADSVGKPQFKGFVYFELAKMFYNTKSYDLASKYAKLSSENAPDSLLKIKALILRSKIFIAEKKINKALSSLNKALEMTKNKKYPFFRSSIYITAANAYLSINQPDKAYFYIQKAAPIVQQSNSTPLLINFYQNLAIYFMQKNMLNKALFYAHLAYANSQYTNDAIVKKQLLALIGKLYNLAGKPSLAYIYTQKAYQLADSLLNNNKIFVFQQEQAKNEVIHKQNIINQQLKNTKRYNFILTTLIIVLIIILINFVYLIYRLIKKNKTLKLQKIQIQKQNQVIRKQFLKHKRLALIVAHTNNCVFIISPQIKISWQNRACYRLASDENKHPLDKILDCKKLKEKIQETLNTKKPTQLITSITSKNNKIWLQINLTPLIANGKILEIIGIASDISKIISAEAQIKKQKYELQQKNYLLQQYNEELQRQKRELTIKNEELIQQQEELRTNTELLTLTINRLQQYSVIINQVNNLIYFVDLDGNITWVNKAFTKITGYTLNSLAKKVGTNINSFKIHSPMSDYLLAAIDSLSTINFTSWLINKDNKKIWLQTSITPILNKNKQLEYIVVIETDITKLKETEEQLELHHKEIRSSIQYASRIQKAILPMPIFLNAIFAENYFIFRKPKDIVSGDFYWAKFYQNKAFFAIADSTGHGIPGAFMSVLGTMAMNMVFDKLSDRRPNKFLYELKETIIHLLHQRGKTDETRDSMDVALCIFDFKNKTLEYSGAYIPLYLVRKRRNDPEPTVKYYPPDKTTIGYDEHNSTFTTYLIQLHENDMIYITTDGYLDQFGGPKNKKFKRKRFIELIKNLYSLPIEEQKRQIIITFQEWKGDNAQIDDILVFGLRYDKNLK